MADRPYDPKKQRRVDIYVTWAKKQKEQSEQTTK